MILNCRDVSHPKSGGAEHVTMEHAKGWVKAGHSVTWLTSHYDYAQHEGVLDGVNFVRRAGSLTIYLYAPLYLLSNAHSFDVIVDETHGFPFFSPLFTRKPVVIFIHEIAGEIWDYMFSFPKNVIGKLLERWYFRVYKHCLFWTDAPSTAKEIAQRGIPATQCVAIPCPIISSITPRLRPKETVPVYLFVSRVVRMKGVEEVIKTFSFIIREQRTAKLWIIGGGDAPYIQELREMLDEYGVARAVTFFGVVSEETKYRLMATAHILLHASVKEGWGLVVLEAASVGTPAVVYNVNGLNSVVKNGKTGIVLKDNSPREMAREAMMLYKNKTLYRIFQDNGRIWAKSFHWSDASKQSIALLQRAIRRKV
ncbi:MAG: glycosyltransferase family 4 protein [Candidatus Gottesmanbacteria bacterium]|nr:glycosyltransferase family 4 protein [Candidatus Gottesmanbacteria bacterium]